jgi:hypothetical protein
VRLQAADARPEANANRSPADNNPEIPPASIHANLFDIGAAEPHFSFVEE